MMKDKIILVAVVSVLTLLSSCSDNIEKTKTRFALRGNVESLVEVVYKMNGENADLSESNITKKVFVEFNRNMVVTSHVEYIANYKKHVYCYDIDGMCTSYIEYKNNTPAYKEVYFYDDLGNCIADSIGLYKNLSESSRYTNYEFTGYVFGDSHEYDILGNKIKSKRLFDEVTYEYDRNNVLIKSVGEVLTDSVLYVNNKYNDCINKTSYLSDAVCRSEEASYEYDYNYNWTTKTSIILSRAYTEPYNLSMEGEVIIRYIRYYNN